MVSYAFIISPYPTFDIKVDENLGISMDTVDTKRKPFSYLNADIFLSILNSMARNRKPVERERHSCYPCKSYMIITLSALKILYFKS